MRNSTTIVVLLIYFLLRNLSAQESISAHLAIRRGSLNSVNGSARKWSRQFLTGISSWAYPKSSADISSMTAIFSPTWVAAVGNHWRHFSRKPCRNKVRCRGPLLPSSHSATFLGSMLIFTFSLQMGAFMGTACSELRLVLRQSNWRRFSGTMSSRCCFQRER